MFVQGRKFIAMGKNVAIVTGGFSSEIVISLKSADTVLKNIDRDIFNPYLIIVKEEKWILKREGHEDITVNKKSFTCDVDGEKISFDCAFIAIHGTPGEDGKLQDYFDKLNIPYTVSGAMTSSLTFDKNACKDFLRTHEILMADSIFVKKGESVNGTEIVQRIGLPCFVKPNSGGSSFGISKVKEESELQTAIDFAFEEDDEILIESFVDGRELTCGVLQKGDELIALGVTEIVTENEFFDYEAKYTKGKADEITPADISKTIENDCIELSRKLYKLLNCKGISRFDYILSSDQLYCLEVNTVPGLTDESLIPKQAAYAGISLKELFSITINEALASQQVSH